MALSREKRFMISAICILVITGCDPIKTTMQYVRLDVIRQQSAQPVFGASVQLKEPYGGVTERFRSLDDRQWLESTMGPLHTGITDEQGMAVVDVKIGAIDRSIGSWNPPDRVTGSEYICKIAERGGREEIFRLNLRPGESYRGDSFIVFVADVGKPDYVQTD